MPRVIVQLTKFESNDGQPTIPTVMRYRFLRPAAGEASQYELIRPNVYPQRNRDFKAGLTVLGNTTLLYSKEFPNKKQNPNVKQLHFDYVGSIKDDALRNETSSIVTNLIVHGKNCNLLRFRSARNFELQSTWKLVVVEVERLFKMLNGALCGITLELHDLRKYEIINLLSAVPRRKAHQMSAGGSIRFNTMLELHKWLHYDYFYYWSYGLGHDVLEIKFEYVEADMRVKNGSLTIWTVYMDVLDQSCKKNLCLFLSSRGSKRRQYKQTLLTDCLEEAFTAPNVGYTLLLFEVPNPRADCRMIDEMLTLANAANLGNGQHSMDPEIYSLANFGLGAKSPNIPSVGFGTKVPKIRSLGWYPIAERV